MHVYLMVNGAAFLLGSDAPEGFDPPFNTGNNIHLSLSPADEEQAKKWYDALSDGGHVTMEPHPPSGRSSSPCAATSMASSG